MMSASRGRPRSLGGEGARVYKPMANCRRRPPHWDGRPCPFSPPLQTDAVWEVAWKSRSGPTYPARGHALLQCTQVQYANVAMMPSPQACTAFYITLNALCGREESTVLSNVSYSFAGIRQPRGNHGLHIALFWSTLGACCKEITLG